MSTIYNHKVLCSQADKDLAKRVKWSAFFYLVLFTIIISFTPYQQDHFTETVVVSLMLVGGIALRSFMIWKFDSLYKKNALIWRAGLFVGILMMAGAWGVLCMLAVTHYNLEWTAMLVLLCTAGLTAAAVTTLTIYAYLINMYLSLMLVPSILSLAILGTPESYGLMMMFIMFISFLIVVAKRLNGEYWSALKNTIEIDRRAKELEDSNKELEAYSYSIAHDLRAPLRSITAYSQILLEDANDKLNHEEKDSLKRIVKAGKFMAVLIDDILNLSRISRSDFQREIADFSKLANDCVQRLMENDDQRSITWQIEPNLRAVGDSRLLSIMLYNLLDNAYKFTTHVENAVIAFGLTPIDQLNDSIQQEITKNCSNVESVFFIKDNGVGFDMKYADKLFGIFQRLHTRDQFDGTGIGLATVARIVHRHGGHVWADSTLGAGATFYFTLSNN